MKFYAGVKKPTPRQKREMMSYLHMTCMYSATREIDEAIDHFEKRATLIFDSREKMEKILRRNILKFHMETVVKELDDLGDTRKKKLVHNCCK